MVLISRLLATALLFVLSPACQAADRPELAAGIASDLETAEAEGFGGAVIVVRHGETIFAEAVGLANREQAIPFTLDTTAQIGSITKTFTGAALANLVAQGRVDLDETVGTYLPNAPEPGRSLTLRDLATHRSGLLDYCGDDFDALTGDALLSDCLARPLAHMPGEAHYSNTAYSVLARVIEAVTGETWEEHLRQTIWEPLGMDDTGFLFEDEDQGDFARGYLNGQSIAPISERLAALEGADWNLRGNGGMQSSPRDMIRFMRAVSGESPVFSDEARALMIAPQSQPIENVAEGLGRFFRYRDSGDLLRTGHGGSDGVFFSYMAWYPQFDIMLYFVGNNGENEILPVLRDVRLKIETLPPAG